MLWPNACRAEPAPWAWVPGPSGRHHPIGIHQPDTGVHVVAPVFGVFERGTAAAFAVVHIAAVEREKAQCNRRFGRSVARAIGVVFLKRRFGLTFGQGLAQGAHHLHLIGGPALVAHALPAATGFERAVALRW